MCHLANLLQRFLLEQLKLLAVWTLRHKLVGGYGLLRVGLLRLNAPFLQASEHISEQIKVFFGTFPSEHLGHVLIHRVQDTLSGLTATLRLLMICWDHIRCCRLLLRWHYLLLCRVWCSQGCLRCLGWGVWLRCDTLLLTTDVLGAELLLIVAFEAVFEDLDCGLQLWGLIVTRTRRLLEQVVFFADLGQWALQVKDLLVLLLEFFGYGDLLLEWDAFLAVGQSQFVQWMNQSGCLMKCRVLSW